MPDTVESKNFQSIIYNIFLKTENSSEGIFIKAVFSNPHNKSLYKKVVVKPTGTKFFAESFTKTQAFQKTISEEEVIQFSLQQEYAQILIETTTQSITILTSKKGTISVIRNPQKNIKITSIANPKNIVSPITIKKNYILPEGTPIPFLVYLGIMTPAGKIVTSKYDKFRQINRFLEYLDDILDNVISTDSMLSGINKRALRIVDFGCGKSYLTFAVHYYLTTIKNFSVEIIGLDLKQDVIELCNKLSKQFNCDGLSFSQGDIRDFKGIKPDIVITLHACDTATDYALDYAVKQQAAAILSVPCCQHEINAQLNKNLADSVFQPLLKYGIIKERFSALVTDALRAEKLEEYGYKVQLLEFIDMTHTPKNILIRAVKKLSQQKLQGNNLNSEFNHLCQALNVTPKIATLLERDNND